jgi:hypothetical protein
MTVSVSIESRFGQPALSCGGCSLIADLLSNVRVTDSGASHRRWQVIVGLLGGVAALITAVVGVLAYVDSRHQSEPLTNAPPTATTRASSISSTDCLIGSWVAKSSEGTYDIATARVQMGGAGYRVSYKTDGTFSYSATDVVLSGADGGHTYERVLNGKVTARYQVAGSQIQYTAETTDGKWEDKVDGKVYASGAMNAPTGAEGFSCSGDILVAFGDHWSQTSNRVAA